MSDVKVNKVVWDVLYEADKKYIATHLKEFGVLKAEQKIVADADTPPPAIVPHINDTSVDSNSVEAMGINWTCRAICDASRAEKNCVLYGYHFQPVCIQLQHHEEQPILIIAHAEIQSS